MCTYAFTDHGMADQVSQETKSAALIAWESLNSIKTGQLCHGIYMAILVRGREPLYVAFDCTQEVRYVTCTAILNAYYRVHGTIV